MQLKSPRLLALIATGAVAATGYAGAQSAALGNIGGIVRDNTGAVVAGVEVTVINTQTGAVRKQTTDSEGHYEATFLQPGIYEVVIGGGTFSKLDQKNVNVQVGDTRTVDARLEAASVSSTVTVTTEAPLVDSEKVASSQTISETLINNLPVNGGASITSCWPRRTSYRTATAA